MLGCCYCYLGSMMGDKEIRPTNLLCGMLWLYLTMMAMFLGVRARLGEGYLVDICFFLCVCVEQAMIESVSCVIFCIRPR